PNFNVRMDKTPYDSCSEAKENRCSSRTVVEFIFDTSSDIPVSFDLDVEDVYIQFSDLRVSNGFDEKGVAHFDDLRPRKSKHLLVQFQMTWDQFQAKKRELSINGYVVGIMGLGRGRVPDPAWIAQVAH